MQLDFISITAFDRTTDEIDNRFVQDFREIYNAKLNDQQQDSISRLYSSCIAKLKDIHDGYYRAMQVRRSIKLMKVRLQRESATIREDIMEEIVGFFDNEIARLEKEDHKGCCVIL